MNILYKLLNKIDWNINVSRSRKELAKNKFQVLNFDDSLNYLIDSKCSLARYGDGEFTLLLNGEFLCPRNLSLGFQDADQQLKKRLVEILNDSNVDQFNLKIAVPRTLVDIDHKNLTDSAIGFWQHYLHELFYKVSSFLKKDYQYLNSQISRFYFDDRNKKQEVIENRISLWKTLWENQDLLIIEGEGSNLGANNGLYDNTKSIQRIKCPNSNAFGHYDEILSSAKEFGKNKMILISLGPTATVLAYDLAKEGYRALDTGYLEMEYHFFLTKATEDSAISGIRISEVESIENDPFPAYQGDFKETDVVLRIPNFIQ